MTTFAVYDSTGHLVVRVHDEVLAETFRAACGGCVKRIDRARTAGELMRDEQRAVAA